MSSSVALDAQNASNNRQASNKDINFGGQHIFNTNSVQSESQHPLLKQIYQMSPELEHQGGVNSQHGLFMPGLQYVHLPGYYKQSSSNLFQPVLAGNLSSADSVGDEQLQAVALDQRRLSALSFADRSGKMRKAKTAKKNGPLPPGVKLDVANSYMVNLRKN